MRASWVCWFDEALCVNRRREKLKARKEQAKTKREKDRKTRTQASTAADEAFKERIKARMERRKRVQKDLASGKELFAKTGAKGPSLVELLQLRESNSFSLDADDVGAEMGDEVASPAGNNIEPSQSSRTSRLADRVRALQ